MALCPPDGHTFFDPSTDIVCILLPVNGSMANQVSLLEPGCKDKDLI